MNVIMGSYLRLLPCRFQNNASEVAVQYTALLCCYGGRFRGEDIVKQFFDSFFGSISICPYPCQTIFIMDRIENTNWFPEQYKFCDTDC